MSTCIYCGREVPPDEEQLVRDRFIAVVGPLVDLVDLTAEQIVEALTSSDALVCAKCFNEMDEEEPLGEFIKHIAKHPTQMAALMFEFTLMHKGANHV
jgi:hypothetical protein